MKKKYVRGRSPVELDPFLKVELTPREVEILIVAVSEGMLRKREEAEQEEREYVKEFHSSYLTHFAAVREKLRKVLGFPELPDEPEEISNNSQKEYVDHWFCII